MMSQPARKQGGSARSVVVDAEAAADVEVLGAEALCADLLQESDHDLSSIAENVHLCDSRAKVAVHPRQLQQRLCLYSVQKPLRASRAGYQLRALDSKVASSFERVCKAGISASSALGHCRLILYFDATLSGAPGT